MAAARLAIRVCLLTSSNFHLPPSTSGAVTFHGAYSSSSGHHAEAEDIKVGCEVGVHLCSSLVCAVLRWEEEDYRYTWESPSALFPCCGLRKDRLYLRQTFDALRRYVGLALDLAS